MAATAPALCPPPTGRAAAAGGRQAALWNWARRRRLRALQARQVERHVRHQLAGLARSAARLRATQGACDSDATGSSSGSGEEEGAGRPAAASPGRRHAEHQWAMQRAAIICRWMWLRAQISDLEYRIRQQTDIYKRLRAAEAPVVLGGGWQPGDLVMKHGRLGSVSLVTSKKKNWLSPSSAVPELSSYRAFGTCYVAESFLHPHQWVSSTPQSLRHVTPPSQWSV
ncbi:KAT8 regulatory NSL complex subunit 1-like [Opisthocomus hoazin]|uniref:KAT8 regulatory NSL complex subunit 1-like n=1 Tax=Opisthocomus hoazin TaxID=30419 RepID=UPI003F5375E9